MGAVNGWRPRDRAEWIGVGVLVLFGVVAIGVLSRALVAPQAPPAPLPPAMSDPDPVTYTRVAWLQVWGALLGALGGGAVTAFAVYITGMRSARAQEWSAEIAKDAQVAAAEIQARAQRDVGDDARRFEYRRQQTEAFLGTVGRVAGSYARFAALAKFRETDRLMALLDQTFDIDLELARNLAFRTIETPDFLTARENWRVYDLQRRSALYDVVQQNDLDAMVKLGDQLAVEASVRSALIVALHKAAEAYLLGAAR